MNFHRVCSLDDLWEGETAGYSVGGHEILLVALPGGVIQAFQGLCPHQDIALAEGALEPGLIVYRAHLWQFDAATGDGVNPRECNLARYPVRIGGEDILVGDEGVEPVRVGA